jgi:hypothetical protein
MTPRIRIPRPNSRSDSGDHGKASQFTKGDKRINRKGGPGRRPMAYVRDWMAWCMAQLETSEAKAKLAKGIWKLDRFGRSDPILSLIIQYAFGKPKAVVEHTVPDLTMLTREELETLGRIADRVGIGSGAPAGSKPLDLPAGSGRKHPTTH